MSRAAAPALLAALLLGGPAAAKPRPPAAAPDAEAWAAKEREACALKVPEGFQIHTGFALGPDEVAAIDGARLDARKRAIEALCAGKSEARCAVVQRHIEGWQDPFYNPATQKACAHVGINRAWIDDDTRDQATLAADLRALAGRVGEVAAQGALFVEPPVWAATGCPTGELGAALVAELRNGFGALGTVRLAAEGSGRAARLSLKLAPSGTDVVVTAAVRTVESVDQRPVEGLRFPADLFGVQQSDTCRFDRDLGLTDGRRPGADGRIVAIDVPSRGSFCEGDAISPALTVSQRSRVRVFSVARSGEAFLVWPPPGSDGVVEGSVPLGEMILVPTPDRSDEKLLAVATAPDADPGPMRGYMGFCRVGVLQESLYPAGAAAGAATFRVLPRSDDACLLREIAATDAPPIPRAPVCGSTR